VGSGGIVIISYLISIVPKVNKYLPTLLADGTSLIYGINEVKDHIGAVIITAIASIVCFVISVPIFNKKQL
jgi:ABC-2 type transport system permease protein